MFDRTAILLLCWIFSQPCSFAQSPPPRSQPPDSAAGTELEVIETKGVLTEPEFRDYCADVFELNLTQRGRFATSAWRGMPPGLHSGNYAGLRLQNPVTGFWNEQWIPYYQTGQRFTGGELLPPGALEPPVPPGPNPISRIIFSQDYIIGLSFVDVNFARKFGRANYLQLSGSNFLGDGSEQLAGSARTDLSTYKITTYRAQLHWSWAERWQADFFFWQMRHRFNMMPQEGTIRDKFKQVGNFFWARFQARAGRGDSLVIIPAYSTVEDKYTRALDEQRDLRYKIPSLEVNYLRTRGAVQYGVRGMGQYIRNRGEHAWDRSDETAAEAAAFVQKPRGDWQFLAEGTVFWHRRVHTSNGGRLVVERKFGDRGGIRAGIFQQAQAPSLLWRSIRHDSIPAFSSRAPIIARGGSVALTIYPAQGFWLHLEPFFTHTRNYPVLLPGQRQWRVQSIENYGLHGKIGLKIWHFWLENDLTYNTEFTGAFAPQLKNVTTVKTSLSLFNRALRLDGILSWRYFGDFRLLDFDRLLYQYRLTETTGGQFGIGDARIQARFRDATLFFIWENFTSTDYFFINNTREELLIFRLGVDWTLLN